MSHWCFRLLRKIFNDSNNSIPQNRSSNPQSGYDTSTSTSSYWGNMARDRDATASSVRPTFPIFLLPTFRIPFRRRPTDSSVESANTSPHSSPDGSPSSSAATSPAGSPPDESFFPPLANGENPAYRIERTKPDTLRCSTCSTDLAFGHQIISKGFTGRYGRAYLVAPPLSDSELSSSPTSTASPAKDLVNVRVGKTESRQLATGWHSVADISCLVCHSKVGWKYVDAKEEAQKYKVGKFILETERVVSFRSWEDIPVPNMGAVTLGPRVEPCRKEAKRGSVRGSMEREGEDEEVVFDSDDEDECDDIFAGKWDRDVVAKRRSKKVARQRLSSERAA